MKEYDAGLGFLQPLEMMIAEHWTDLVLAQELFLWGL